MKLEIPKDIIESSKKKELEAPKSKRKRLIKPYYFAGVYRALRKNDRTSIDTIFRQIYSICKTDNEKENIDSCYKYFINNFESICLRMIKNEEILGCSAEGQVSHILSNRLSSRPMG